jgi:hypothetical protein
LGTLCFVAGGRANEAIVSLWRPATWNGERAFEAATPRWLAIVSVERARLVYLGGRDGTHNLLFAPSTRNDPAGWGGHRLWLGPQSTWSRGWPPPDAWEKSGAENVRVDGARLELKLADAGDGWPRLTRVYRWEEDGRLHCEALSNGGTRSAQFIHIVQVPAEAEVEVHSAPRPDLPVGYAQLHLGRTPSPQRKFQPLPHVSESAGVLHLRVANVKEKLGFEPQPLVARSEGSGLRVERGVSDGVLLAAPDEGLFTQVYLGDNHTPFIELEQLSPLWKAGSAARCEIILEPQEN